MNKITAILIGSTLFALGAGGGYWIGRQAPDAAAGTFTTGSSAAAASDRTDPETGRRVLYWHDPMVPGQKFDKPGKSPFMDMDLVPVYADEGGESGTVTIDPRLQQNLGVRIVEVASRPLAPTVEAVGSVAFNERAVEVVTARATGFIDKLYVRAPLDPVRAGQPLAELLAPDWVAAQEEYLALSRSAAPDAEVLREAARRRLMVLGMPESVIRSVEREGRPRTRVVLAAPIDGVIGELSAREGMTAAMGSPLFRINGLATVWVNAELPEAQAALVQPGSPVAARLAAYPAERFTGKVAALLPEVDPATRTLKVRIELANPKGLLKPGMFATVDFSPAAPRQEVLVVPSEALIRTGTRNLLILALDGGKFRPLEVEPGIETDGLTEIRKGLQAGQKVVASAQFLIDSEASLKSTVERMGSPPAAAPGPAQHHGEGVVEAIDKEQVTLSHGPIPSMNWPAMTMSFKLPAGAPQVEVGSRVNFDFAATPKGEFEIRSIAPATSRAEAGR
ncbi:efflux RND transporter periplasmic adaptor subunit [Aromatoleum toluvorans]|uniref:Efflux RND transporter periplasmic adaptor subunit n=1 Tax=Aromatoleum toluvorans TaxID=92002 RepID=A0ABX1Q3I3_9RHOO|nr:efflux RND transporter periplasmic adaptor subunit [Aromatoleum toluvorans]NMG45487.1 efflux RND transporter periplasmic adaptor subunit [Aromatoleum toluvorans]